MKTFTRLFVALSLWLAAGSAYAATHIVTVGDFEYSPQFLVVAPGDQVTFQWQSGSHPTMSDSSPAAFPTFQMNASSPQRTITLTALGQYDYHCMAHGGPQSGMWGSITVSIPTASASARALASALNVYPNPARGGQITVSAPESKAGTAYRLRVTNVIGREVRSVVLRPELVANGHPVDLSSLPAGVYFCSLLVGDKAVATKRVTLQD
ncbi:T9SS type A sorting domain-containing protein [Hymenobacter sp. B81]|uniref:T9SS type A sorting domain-containing protein n=1 Tax=Hymenobacter sp. B81 TaxID=3344878 RepID=UPI0037DD30DD